MKDIKQVAFMIQARLSSQRCPQKMIRPFAGTTLLDINIQNARRLLQEARELAESHGLVKLATKITTQNEKMLDQLENWDEFIRKYYEFIKAS